MSQEDNVVILDSRSQYFYDRKHLSGAIHLDFSEFTQESLDKILPSRDTKILIYCNNNFSDDPINFASKTSRVAPKMNDDQLMLALNIPTYLNLYGYGYENVYELNELVSVDDPRITLVGTDVKKKP